PITRWEEMFLPSKLAVGVEHAGLVTRETVLLDARRPALRASAPKWTLEALGLGVAAAAIMSALGHFAARGLRAARLGLGIALAAIGVVLGILGCLFLFLWVVTNHEVAYHNENLLPCTPLALGLVGAGIGVARADGRAVSR